MNPVNAIPVGRPLVLVTNLYPLKTDPYNTPYEGVNWAEVYQYYPPNGIRYINPYQGAFAPTDTRQLKFPAVPRVSATAITTFSRMAPKCYL